MAVGERSASATTALADTLRAVGFDAAGVTAMTGRSPYAALEPAAAWLLHRTLPQDALATAIRLLVLRAPVDRSALERDLGTDAARALDALGLLEGGERVRARRTIVPYEDLLLAGDQPQLEPARGDRYVAVSPSSATLAALVPPSDGCGRALDLGTGCGLHALRAARRGHAVVGTDFSDRALSYARLNASLNAVADAEWRQGDWLTPLGPGERFDLVTANLPYVVSPDAVDAYQDSGLPGDTVTRSLLPAIPALLAPGGHGVLLGSWARREGEVWPDVVGDALEGTSCDGVVYRLGSFSPLEHTCEWNEWLHRHDPGAFAATVDRWLAYFAELAIERIDVAAVVLRRTERHGGAMVALATQEGPGDAAAAQVARILDVVALAESPDLATVVSLAPGLVVEVARLCDDGAGLRPFAAAVALPGGLEGRIEIPPPVAAMLESCDGTTPLGLAVDRTAATLGLDPGPLRSQSLEAVEALWRRGLIHAPRVG